jgi:Holliday junction resolvase RusA-like endonuclease
VPFRWKTSGNRVYIPKPQKDWSKKVVFAAKAEAMLKETCFSGAVAVKAEFVFCQPKTVKREEHTVRPDLTNCWKLVEDACTAAGVWRDDSQVVKAEISKRYGQNPGVHVSVYRNE